MNREISNLVLIRPKISKTAILRESRFGSCEHAPFTWPGDAVKNHGYAIDGGDGPIRSSKFGYSVCASVLCP